MVQRENLKKISIFIITIIELNLESHTPPYSPKALGISATLPCVFRVSYVNLFIVIYMHPYYFIKKTLTVQHVHFKINLENLFSIFYSSIFAILFVDTPFYIIR